MVKWIFTIGIYVIFSQGYSQHMAAFHDFSRHFMVFDNGITKEIDHLPASSFQIGGNYVAFISNSGQFQVYYKGEVKTLSVQTVSNYFTTSHLLVYMVYNQLFVFDEGDVQVLSGNVKNFAVGDSIVAFYDDIKRSSHVYYKGKIFDLERSLVGEPINEFRTGDNLFAYYNNNTKYFKAFYQGQIWDILQTASNIEYLPGRNILAYIDKSKNSLHVFYKGQIYDLEEYEPKSMKIGDDLFGYVDNLGAFKIFYNGETQIISQFEPDFYEVKDSLMVYSEDGYFKVFYKGKVFEMGNYVPEKYQMQESTLAFIGVNGWLEAFTCGEFIRVTNDLVSSYSVYLNLVCFNTTINKVKVFYNKQLYETK